MWGAHGALSLFFDGADGISAAVASVALALWEFMRWRPPLTPLGVAVLGGSLLALLAVGSSAWLSWAGLWLFGNVFVDAYGPAMGAAALEGVVAFLTVARGPLAASAVSIFFVFSAAAYFAGLRLYPDSTPLTNILMPALAASSLYAAVAAALARWGLRWRAVHVLAFLALGLLSASGPHLFNPGYVKFALVVPGSAVWTLEPPPYPSRLELSSVAYRVDSEQVPLEGCGSVPTAVVAVLDVAVDGVWTKVEVRYGVEEALALRAPLGFALAGDYLVVAGPTYGEGGVSLLSAMYWNATGGSWAAAGRPPVTTWLGLGPSPFSESS
jgi:hypothetical protein